MRPAATESRNLSMHVFTMTRVVGTTLAAAALCVASGLATAKLPAPTEEQKAKAEVDKAKATWSDKVAAFQLCKAQDKTAAAYQAGGKGAHTQPGTACADPGPFVPPTPAASAPVAKG
ncbi:signal peptide protein [Ralstonia sp. NT80]|nr:signal peptide protein [Ralstonia sp. NT80]